ncbi:hypothetical protein VB712_18910, partial [Spirulina sp. CCNP1310]|uniref:hypothetical protein n=1 Tax=Spirulina sp. CCNP1310 TaxID=3110249 RepID=UPI002B2202B6
SEIGQASSPEVIQRQEQDFSVPSQISETDFPEVVQRQTEVSQPSDPETIQRQSEISQPSSPEVIQRQEQDFSVPSQISETDFPETVQRQTEVSQPSDPETVQRQSEIGQASSPEVIQRQEQDFSVPSQISETYSPETVQRQTEVSESRSPDVVQQKMKPEKSKNAGKPLGQTQLVKSDKLPQVLNQISRFSPLRRSPPPTPTPTPIIQKQPNPQTSPSPNPGTTIPESWSNIAELLAGSGPNPESIQRQANPEPQTPLTRKSLTPQKKPLGKTKNLQANQGKPKKWNSVKGVIQAQTDPKLKSTKTLEFTPQGVKVLGQQNIQGTIQKSDDVDSEKTDNDLKSEYSYANQYQTEQTEADHLERLAHAIYHIVQQRITIEQERHGRGYAGRRPW